MNKIRKHTVPLVLTLLLGAPTVQAAKEVHISPLAIFRTLKEKLSVIAGLRPEDIARLLADAAANDPEFLICIMLLHQEDTEICKSRLKDFKDYFISELGYDPTELITEIDELGEYLIELRQNMPEEYLLDLESADSDEDYRQALGGWQRPKKSSRHTRVWDVPQRPSASRISSFFSYLPSIVKTLLIGGFGFLLFWSIRSGWRNRVRGNRQNFEEEMEHELAELEDHLDRIQEEQQSIQEGLATSNRQLQDARHDQDRAIEQLRRESVPLSGDLNATRREVGRTKKVVRKLYKQKNPGFFKRFFGRRPNDTRCGPSTMPQYQAERRVSTGSISLEGIDEI